MTAGERESSVSDDHRMPAVITRSVMTTIDLLVAARRLGLEDRGRRVRVRQGLDRVIRGVERAVALTTDVVAAERGNQRGEHGQERDVSAHDWNHPWLVGERGRS